MSQAGLQRFRGPEYSRLLGAARKSLERTGGLVTGRVSVGSPDDAERKAIIGITGVHQPAGTRRLTVSLADLDEALRRATGSGLAGVRGGVGGPRRDRPGEAARLAAGRAEVIGTAEGSPLYATSDWYRAWLAALVSDGTMTRLASSGDPVGQAVRVLEFLAGRPATAGTIELPALAVRLTGDTKALNHGSTLSTLVLRALALRSGTGRPSSAADRRELWDVAGVFVRGLARRV